MKRRSVCAGSCSPRRDTVGRTGSRGRPATIALLAAAAILLAIAPAALATGRAESRPFDGEGIEGRAVDAASSAGIAGIEVCAYAADSEETSGLFGECTETNAAGEYALLGLSAHVAVDIPLELPTSGRRPCEDEARAFLGSARSSIFYTPPWWTLTAYRLDGPHPRGVGVSIQTWNILPKVHEAMSARSATRHPRVGEVHPECSFRAMAGATKRTAPDP